MNEKVDYWLELCREDLITANALLEKKRYLHAGFFCHHAAEAALKAVVAHKTDKIPPRIHDLGRLANLGGIQEELSEKQMDLLDKLSPLQMEARYPDPLQYSDENISPEYCRQLLNETEELLCWIKTQLEK